MSKVNESRIILNLAGPLSSSVSGFLKQCGFIIAEKDKVTPDTQILFILVNKHAEDWKTLENTYDTIRRGIKIVSFTKVFNMKSFISIGGRATVTEEMFQDKVSLIFLKRIFKDDLQVHMDEVFGGNFLKYKNQKILGHSRSGNVADIISIEAQEQGFNNVAIRGFIYNVIYYLSYLKQSEIALFPFDLEYAQNSKYLAIQIVAPVKNFLAEYIQDSFNLPNSSNPVDYLLTEAKNLTHVFDISYLEKSNAVIFLALWNKNAENPESTFGFNQVKSVKRIYLEIEEKIQEAQLAIVPLKKASEAKIEENGQKTLAGKGIQKLENADEQIITKGVKSAIGEKLSDILPDDIEDDVVSQILSKAQDALEEERDNGGIELLSEDAVLVKGSKEVNGENVTVREGSVDLGKGRTLVKGSVEERDGVTIVHDNQEQEEEVSSLVKGSNDALKQDVSLVKGQKDALKQDVSLVKGQQDEEEDVSLVKGQKDALKQDVSLVKGQKEIASKSTRVKGNEEDVSEESTIVSGKSETVRNTKFGGTPADRFSTGFATKLSQSKNGNPKELLKAHVTDFIADEVSFLVKDGRQASEKDIEKIAQVISSNLKIPHEKAKEMVSFGLNQFQQKQKEQDQLIIGGGGQSQTEAILINKLRDKDDEIRQLLLKLDVLRGQVAANKSKEDKITEINGEAQSVELPDDVKRFLDNKKEYQRTTTIVSSKNSSTPNEGRSSPFGQNKSASNDSHNESKNERFSISNKNDSSKDNSKDERFVISNKNEPVGNDQKNEKFVISSKNESTENDSKKERFSMSSPTNSQGPLNADNEITAMIAKMEQTPEGKEQASVLRNLISRESELIEMAKSAELELKKKEMEAQGKEVSWARALEQSEKNLRNKELLLSKAKEGVKASIEKKDRELAAMKDRISQLSQKVNGGGVSEEQFFQAKESNRQLQTEVETLKKKMISIVTATKAAVQNVRPSEDAEEAARVKLELKRIAVEKNNISKQNEQLNKALSLLKEQIKNKPIEEIQDTNEDIPEIAELDPKMKSEFQRITNEKNNLRRQNEQQSKALADLRAQIKDYQRDEAASKEEVQAIAELDPKMKNEFQRITNEKNTLRRQNEKMAKELLELKELGKGQGKIEIEETKEDAPEIAALDPKLKSEFKKLSTEKNVLSRQNEQLNKTVLELKEQIKNQAKDDVAGAKGEVVDSDPNMKAEFKRVSSEKNILSKQNEQLNKTIQGLQEQVKALAKNEMTDSKEDMPGLAGLDPNMKAEFQRISSERSNLGKQNGQLNKIIADLREELKVATAEVAQNAAIAATAGKDTDAAKGGSISNEEAARLRNEIQRMGAEKIQFQAQQTSLKAENNTIKNEMNDLKRKLKELEQTEAAKKAATDAANSQANVNGKEGATMDPVKMNVELNKMVKERDVKIEKNSEKMKELEAKIATLTKEMESATQVGEQAGKTKIAQLESAGKKLTADLHAAQNLAAETKKEVTKVKAESVGLKNQIDKLKKDLEKFEKKGKKAA